jgi:tripartite-type tricarboxylate transporter receptor subunit TctC
MAPRSTRRTLLGAAALALTVASTGALAQAASTSPGQAPSTGSGQAASSGSGSFPTKPIRWIVPYAAGGPADVIARAMQPKLQEALGQSVVIDNRPGGNANIGHELVAKAPPDGYTILYVVPNVVTNTLLYRNMVDPVKELAPVARITTQNYILVANPNFPARTVAEMIEQARKGGVNCASGGGLPGFGCMWFKSFSKADFTHVLYKGNGPAMNDLLGGQVNVMIDLFNTAMPQVNAGRARAIATTGSRRGPPLPNLPVIGETIPGFALEGWHGIMAPPGTPAPVIDRLNQAIRTALGDPGVARRISESGIEVTPSSPAEFAATLREDLAKYSRITQDAGIKPE